MKTDKAIVFPFAKEEYMLAANEDDLNIDIVDYYDIRESGKVGLSVKAVAGFGNNEKKIKNILSIDFDVDFDLIICGHLDIISRLTKIDWKKRIEEIAVQKRKKIFFLDLNCTPDSGQ